MSFGKSKGVEGLLSGVAETPRFTSHYMEAVKEGLARKVTQLSGSRSDLIVGGHYVWKHCNIYRGRVDARQRACWRPGTR